MKKGKMIALPAKNAVPVAGKQIMKKNFSVILFLIFGLLSFSSSFAQMRATSGDVTYVIPFVTVSSGGHQNLSSPSGDIHLNDLKGQGVIGAASATGTPGYTLGLGGIYGWGTLEITAIVPPPPPPGTTETTHASDNGLIVNTQITRNTVPGHTNEIKITWLYNNAGPTPVAPGVVPLPVGVTPATSADIYRCSGPTPTNFSTVADDAHWTRIIAATTSPYVDTAMTLGSSYDAYYRVVPGGTAVATIFGNSAGTPSVPLNNRTVGKIDLAISINELKLASLPMYAGQMGPALSGQVTSGQLIVYPQSGGGLGRVPYSGSVFTGGMDIKPATGFWLENDATARVITFLGSFETNGTANVLDLDLNGNPVPYALSSVTLGGQSGDILYPQAGGGLGRIVKGTNWPSFSLVLNQGFWYEKTGVRGWNINLYNGSDTRITGP
jgi:hypothetical protein